MAKKKSLEPEIAESSPRAVMVRGSLQYHQGYLKSWDEVRELVGFPPSVKLKERGKCYDCGEDLSTDHWHQRSELLPMNRVYIANVCCRCLCHDE